MIVYVEECYAGHENWDARMTTRDGKRLACNINGIKYPSRRLSTMLLDRLEREGCERSNIRLQYR